MNRSFGPMGYNYQDGYGIKDFSNNYIRYPENNRYHNAYGNYRGGYDRSNHGPPLGFGPIGFMGPHGPPGPHFLMQGDMRWRRGCPPGPPHDMLRVSKKEKIIKYLIRCGMTRDNVINLPGDVLSMMQPLNCGLCAQKFETIDLSRIHYASKNHLKNQKKWLNQRSNSGSHNKEPLRSRELYCELCDVQITSTGHAESHYAGKPHRSIVEGRKNPRNPFLLQPNRQGRLKALIRREMKFLKKHEAAAGDMKVKSESKSGDLYCEICKTSMMCTEQMTTHLNGKRHLSKEKQHILRLMKGEVSDDSNKNTNEKIADENADQAEDMEGDDDGENDEDGEDAEDGEGAEDGEDRKGKGDAAKGTVDGDDDWGEGGEDWKPSAEDY